MSVQILFIIFVYVITSLASPCNSISVLEQGMSLSVENAMNSYLVSSNGVFAAGFYPAGTNAYYFAVWFSDPSCTNDCTAVWMANRDYPVNGVGSKLSLQDSGNILLTDASDRSIVWLTETTSLSPVQLRMENSGNLVLVNVQHGTVLWQSFDSPTDTLLPLQRLTRDVQLVSSRSESNRSTGLYKLFFDNDNTLRMLYNGPEVSSLYWYDPWKVTYEAGRSSYNNSRVALFDLLGRFKSSDNLEFYSTDYGKKMNVQRRLTMDPDGNLRLHSRQDGERKWTITWQAISQPCKIHGICGPNSYCTYNSGSDRKCLCLPGYSLKDETDWVSGCKPNFNHPPMNTTEIDYLKLDNIEFYGYDYVYQPNFTVQRCRELCTSIPSCVGFQIRHDPKDAFCCYPKILFLNGYHSPNFAGSIYLKFPKKYLKRFPEIKSGFGLDCFSKKASIEIGRQYLPSNKNEKLNLVLKVLLIFIGAMGGIEFIFIFLVLLLTRRNQDRPIEGYSLAPTVFKRFSFTELKKATRNFSEKIGLGAGSQVYKGILNDGRVAAIKRLNDADQAEAEFLAEVSSIGNLNHMNLIDMWGYCVHNKHRFLIYEFMEHGSLAENLYSNNLDWKKRYQIALGTARGLAYLHEECLEWILHCDVKPHNILLDSGYQPKVSDFGLSKLLKRGELKNSNFSRMRGTRGYMAPEWVFNLPITPKVDVYSYGTVVLEMITGRSAADGRIYGVEDDNNDGGGDGEGGEIIEHKRLVSWVREKRSMKDFENKTESWVKEIIDPRLGDEYELHKMESMVSVALQCVEEDKEARPTMSQVVEMLCLH